MIEQLLLPWLVPIEWRQLGYETHGILWGFVEWRLIRVEGRGSTAEIFIALISRNHYFFVIF